MPRLLHETTEPGTPSEHNNSMPDKMLLMKRRRSESGPRSVRTPTDTAGVAYAQERRDGPAAAAPPQNLLRVAVSALVASSSDTDATKNMSALTAEAGFIRALVTRVGARRANPLLFAKITAPPAMPDERPGPGLLDSVLTKPAVPLAPPKAAGSSRKQPEAASELPGDRPPNDLGVRNACGAVRTCGALQRVFYLGRAKRLSPRAPLGLHRV